MPKFTGKELLEKSQALLAVITAKGGKEIDFYAAARLRNFGEAVMKSLQSLEKDRKAIIDHLEIKDGEVATKEKLSEFTSEWEKVLSIEIVLPNVSPLLKLKELEKTPLSAVDLSNIQFLLDEE